ncbi:MAG: hypothetical protein IJ552_01495 [Prevotella sp.]|nr:hypothetical protein [Prevotella sp.]
MKQIIRKTLLVLLGGVLYSSAWASDILVPTPVYFNDFSTAVSGEDGIEIVGNGVFEKDADARFGRIFHNDPGATPTKEKRTNYLKLPDNVLSNSATTKEITIGFWVNVKNAADYWFSPIFSAYGLSPAANAEAGHVDNNDNWPVFVLESRGLMQVNNGGWDNFEAGDNVNTDNYESTVWLDDKEWHYYTMTMTTSSAKIYIDGNIINEWNIDGSEGHYVGGFFEYGANYKYICLGGNQAWDWSDPDPAFGFDDFAVYNVALTKEQIDQIRANKLDRTASGTQIGAMSGDTSGLGEMTTKIKLYPGDSYSYSFINYNTGGTNNWRNFLVPVYDPDNTLKISVRADNWENMHHVGETWGSNAGCTSDFNWDNWIGNMNGAKVDMTVSFTADKVFTMTSKITTVDGSTWKYSYTNDYTDSPIDLKSYDYIQPALSVQNAWLDVLSENFSARGFTMNATGWGTYASDFALDFSTPITGLSPYFVTGRSSGSIVKSEITTSIPAGTGILLNGEASTTYSIPVVASSTTDVSDNKLVRGDGINTVNAVTGKDRYVMINKEGTAVFRKIGATGPVVAADRAYIEFDADGEAHELLSLDGDDVTGIKNIKVGSEDNIYYNLNGQRVLYPTKGLYIVNGKKVIIK